MKLKNFLKFKPFLDIRKEMGADDLGEFKLSLNWEELTLEENEKLQKEGIEFEESDLRFLDFLDDETIAYKNRRVLLYIRDVKKYGSREIKLPKFHISYCKTLKEMEEKDKSDRYVVSVRTDGIFEYNIISYNKEESHEGKLDVCKNCLSRLNYNNYNSNRNEAFNSFDLNEFFIRFSCSPIKIVPRETNRTAPLNKYPKNWNQKSFQFKNSAKWKCKECKVDLSKNRKFLHSHHKNGSAYNCKPSNLEALCIRCHANQHDHSHLKNLPEYKEYMERFFP